VLTSSAFAGLDGARKPSVNTVRAARLEIAFFIGSRFIEMSLWGSCY
jgi:hypothetical protein